MKTLPIVLCTAALSALVSSGVHLALRPAEAASRAPATQAASAPREGWREELEALRRELREQGLFLESRIEALSRQPVVAAPAELGEEPSAEAIAAGAPATVLAGPRPSQLPAAELMALLTGPGLSGLEREELWNELSKAGRVKELVDLFEARAKADPSNPDLQVELGGAYIRMIQEVGAGPLAGVWAGKADQAFDRALGLDPRHADARLSKAISLSFWPPMFGKQAESVKQFEILIEQLRNGAPDPKYAQAWLLLGNLHQQQGKADAALAVWKEGAQLFPADPELAQKAP